MILVLYNAALVLALLVSAPWWIWRLLTTEKYREGLQERLGRVRVLKAGDGGRNGRPVIWVHAVSVGEVLAVSRLVRALDEEIPEYFVVISTTTRTGQAVARERFGASGSSIARWICRGPCGRICGLWSRRCWCWRRASSGRICCLGASGAGFPYWWSTPGFRTGHGRGIGGFVRCGAPF